MQPIKPIETRYKGYRFRSRLEARWAVFFDHVGLRYDYEPEGYVLPSGPYLPDFFVHNVGMRTTKERPGVWVEIKPTYIESEWKKLKELCIATGRDGLLLASTDVNNDWNGEKMEAPIYDYGMVFMECERCKHIKIEYSEGNYTICECCGSTCNNESENIENAIQRALSARFEFGESG